jgi:hypothetical protein
MAAATEQMLMNHAVRLSMQHALSQQQRQLLPPNHQELHDHDNNMGNSNNRSSRNHTNSTNNYNTDTSI